MTDTNNSCKLGWENGVWVYQFQGGGINSFSKSSAEEVKMFIETAVAEKTTVYVETGLYEAFPRLGLQTPKCFVPISSGQLTTTVPRDSADAFMSGDPRLRELEIKVDDLTKRIRVLEAGKTSHSAGASSSPSGSTPTPVKVSFA